MVLLTNIATNASNHTKCVSVSTQKCKTQPTLINFHPNKYNQELHYYPFVVKLGKCVGSCNTLNDLYNRVCVSNKTEDLNVHVFNMIIGKTESKVITKYISCECKKGYACEKDYIWNPATCSCQNGKYLASILDDSAMTCDEVIESYDEETKNIPTNFDEKIQPIKHKILLTFLLITIALLIAVNICRYLI